MRESNGGEDSLAPVIPLFGASPVSASAGSEEPDPDWNTSWTTDEPHETAVAPDEAEVAAAGEAALLRKLRTRSLSVREARAVLADHDLTEGSIEAVIARCEGHGYLDDARLAEQLVHTAVDRKGQGRHAVAQTLAQRGIAREVVDASLAELPDDEFERALAFARTKVRGMRDLDRDVALRRLSGQLARRGYGGVSFEAARRALGETDSGGSARGGARPGHLGRPGVRFEP